MMQPSMGRAEDEAIQPRLTSLSHCTATQDASKFQRRGLLRNSQRPCPCRMHCTPPCRLHPGLGARPADNLLCNSPCIVIRPAAGCIQVSEATWELLKDEGDWRATGVSSR